MACRDYPNDERTKSHRPILVRHLPGRISSAFGISKDQMISLVRKLLPILLTTWACAATPTVQFDYAKAQALFTGHHAIRSIAFEKAFGKPVRTDQVWGFSTEPDGPDQTRFYVWLAIVLKGDFPRIDLTCWSFYIYEHTTKSESGIFGAKVFHGVSEGSLVLSSQGSIKLSLRDFPGLGRFDHTQEFFLHAINHE